MWLDGNDSAPRTDQLGSEDGKYSIMTSHIEEGISSFKIAQGGLDLEMTNGAWPRPLRTLDATFPGDLPDTIVASIRVGFRCLSKAAQQVLIVTAILGERASTKRIACATELEGKALHTALDELEWCAWLVAESRGYTFVARIVRDVVARDMVTEGERQRILAKKC